MAAMSSGSAGTAGESSPSPSSSSSLMISFACESPMMWSISPGRILLLTGTATPPARDTATLARNRE